MRPLARINRRTFIGMAAVPLALRAADSPDGQFVAAANDYIRRTLENAPEFATRMGEHRYDARFSDYTPAGRERVITTERDCIRRLGAVAPDRLERQNNIDFRILSNRAGYGLWRETILREYEWNPMVYNPGNSLYLLLERDFAPLEERLESVRGRLEALPGMLATAKQNLKTAPHIHAETALQQNKGTIALVRDVVKDQAAKAGMEDKVAPGRARAIAALEDWGRWLESDLLPRAHREFRLGPELYRVKLRYALDSETTPNEIRAAAEADLKRAQAEIYDTAVALYRKWSPGTDVSDRTRVIRSVLDRLAETHPSADTIVGLAERHLSEATEFVRSRQLVTVPATPLRIVLMPEFERGVAVANCNSPGSLEKKGETFLNISPPPAKWTEAQVTSYYREYNDFMVRDLVVHEAMPGHYLQIAHSNQFRGTTPVRAVFSSGPFVEGWAVYSERFMAEHGFGGPEVRIQQLKMWLRTIINALLDVGIHDGSMTEQQAMDLMMNEGFQERSEAAGKWRRACLTSAQLPTYYAGASALLRLRDEYQKRNGPVRDWKAFHDRMLSFGSPAPRYVRELMLG